MGIFYPFDAFYKYPFEFTAGFRRFFPVLMLACFLTTMGIVADNFNLSLFGLLLLILCCTAFYTDPENEFFVWIYAASPNVFLIQKIQTAFWYLLLLSLPLLITLVLFYPEKWWIILLTELIGFLVLCVSILGKYAAYPSKLNLTQALGIVFSILFPPAIVLIIPLFYFLSLKKINPFLK